MIMGKVVSLERNLHPAAIAMPGLSSWASTMRERERIKFAALGMPNRRMEAWKYSDLAQSLRETRTGEWGTTAPAPAPGAFIAAFVDGQFDPVRSILPKSAIVGLPAVYADGHSPYADILSATNADDNHPVISMNLAGAEDGFVLHLRAGEVLQSPLHIHFEWSEGSAPAPEGQHLRLLLQLDAGAEATIVETHSGAPGLATIVTECRLADNARLTHFRFDHLAAPARQTAVTTGTLGENAFYKGFYLSRGAHFCRHDALLDLVGKGAAVEIDGAFLLADGRHCDNTTVITHTAANTTSHQAFRGVLGDKAEGVYQGCVRVRPDAQKTDARQMSRTLLLAPTARISTKPELEIFADDVKCGHGATAGELDANALFYLRARGIAEAEARALLIAAFIAETTATIADPALRATAEKIVADWLDRHAREVVHAQ